MIEEPPPLPFPSLNKLKVPAKEILDAQRNPATPDVEFKIYLPVDPTSETDKKKQRPNKKACDVCKRKKVKCDNNVMPNEVCTRATCPCENHVPYVPEENDKDSSTIFTDDKIRQFSSSTITINPAYSSFTSSLSTSILSSATAAITSATSATTPIYNGSGSNISNNIDAIPPTTVFRKPGLLYSGHYAGETSFCGSLAPESQPPVIIEEDQFPTFDPTPPQPPYITEKDQLYLIDIYYENVNSFFPTLNKQELLIQHGLVMSNRFTYLSPLFFYALFARAAHLETKRKWTQSQQSFTHLGDECIDYVSALANCYKDKPRISTVLALIIMANHLEQTKLPEKLTRSWLWAGEAFRIALDLGVHRSLISAENDHLGQLCIRTFWLAYITDCTISMTYGRPSATEEKVLDVTSPKRIITDDTGTAEWLEGLNVLISLSKIAARVIKFNYCPPPPFKIQGPVKRHNAFLASVDSWLTDIMHPNSNEPDSPISNTANVIYEESIMSKRMSFQKKMFFYTNLILLHRPYVNDSIPARNSTRPSNDICTFAAILVTDIANKLEYDELVYHSKSPMIVYALVMALRVHIMNALTNPTVDKFNAEKNFTKSIATLDKLPQSQNRSSLLYEALTDLKDQYNNRFSLSLEKEEEIRLRQQQQTEQPAITPDDPISSNVSTGKRKEKPCSISSIDTHGINANTPNSNLSVKQYLPPNELTIGRKKKKTKTTAGTVGTPPTTTTSIDGQRRQKNKQRSHQHVFPTITAGSSSGSNTHQQQMNNLIPHQQDETNQNHCLRAEKQRDYQQQQQQQQQEQYIQQQQQVPFAGNNNNESQQATGNNSSISSTSPTCTDHWTILEQYSSPFRILDYPHDILGLLVGMGDSSSSSFSSHTPNILNYDVPYDTFMLEDNSFLGGGGGNDETTENVPIWCVSNENNSRVSITPATGYSHIAASSSTDASSPASTYAASSVNNTVHGGSPSTTCSYPNSTY